MQWDPKLLSQLLEILAVAPQVVKSLHALADALRTSTDPVITETGNKACLLLHPLLPEQQKPPATPTA